MMISVPLPSALGCPGQPVLGWLGHFSSVFQAFIVAAISAGIAMGSVVLPGLTSAAMAKEQIAGPIPADVERVIDGDTVKVRARIWLEQDLVVSVRIANIDAPELFRPKCPAEKTRARAAKNFVSTFFADGTAWLHDVENGKYAGRVVARLTNSAGDDLGEALVSASYAVNANRGNWCQ